MKSSIRLVPFLVAILLGLGCAAPAPAIPEPTLRALQSLHGDMLQARTATEFYVRNLRKQVPAGSAELVEAERLYEEARGGVNGWLANIQSMVRSGIPLSEDGIAPRRKAASDAVVEFNTYADRVLRERTGQDAKDAKFLAVSVGDLFTLGRNIADEVNKRRQARLEAYERWAQAESAKLDQDRWLGFAEVK
ncbi:MAG: hypothetical protein DVB31_00580 [Verrucomicrobia bacterium]|nr:MAG: hypothetical protein DVB31_00580 [Verrucomicrobiota bacterium]